MLVVDEIELVRAHDGQLAVRIDAEDGIVIRLKRRRYITHVTLNGFTVHNVYVSDSTWAELVVTGETLTAVGSGAIDPVNLFAGLHKRLDHLAEWINNAPPMSSLVGELYY